MFTIDCSTVRIHVTTVMWKKNLHLLAQVFLRWRVFTVRINTDTHDRIVHTSPCKHEGNVWNLCRWLQYVPYYHQLNHDQKIDCHSWSRINRAWCRRKRSTIQRPGRAVVVRAPPSFHIQPTSQLTVRLISSFRPKKKKKKSPESSERQSITNHWTTISYNDP